MLGFRVVIFVVIVYLVVFETGGKIKFNKMFDMATNTTHYQVAVRGNIKRCNFYIYLIIDYGST